MSGGAGGPKDTALAIVVVVVIGSITVAGPVIFYVAASDIAAATLATIKDLMSAHDAVIMLLVLGAKILGPGLAGLFG